MPAGNPRDNWIKEVGQRLFARRAAAERHENLLPEDFTGQVFENARAEAAKIRERLAAIGDQLERIEREIKKTRDELWAASSPVTIPAKRRGDILGAFTIEAARPNPTLRVKGEKALKVQARLGPLETTRRRLYRVKGTMEAELGTLRRICALASENDVALLNLLSGRWNTIIAGVGMDIPRPAKLARVHYPVDPMGYDLPAAAKTPDGQPDMPKRGMR